MRKLVAKTIGLLFHKKNANRPFSGPFESVVILATEKTGDSILLTPLIRILRSNFPNLEIHIVSFTKISADFFRHDRNITAIHEVKKDPVKYWKDVLSKEFDLLFNTKDGPSTNFLLQTALIRSRFKVGHNNPYHKGIFDNLLEVDFHTRMALKNCSLLPLLSVIPGEDDYRPYLPHQPISDVMAAFLEKLEAGSIGINISAGGRNRYWTEKKWSNLISIFPEQRFLVFSAPADNQMKERLEDSHVNVLPSPRTNNIYEVGLLTSKLRLLISPDTALIHVASCYRIPVIGLYRQSLGDLNRFGPFLTEYELVVSPSNQVCDISLHEVSAALQKMLS